MRATPAARKLWRTPLCSRRYRFGALTRRGFRRLLLEAEGYCRQKGQTFVCREDRGFLDSVFVVTAPGYIHVTIDHFVEKLFAD